MTVRQGLPAQPLAYPLPSRTLRDFRLQSGVVLPEVKVAYHSLGRLSPRGDNAVCVIHGYTGNPGVIGGAMAEDGTYEEVIGPGRAIDTDRFFVVAPNHLGGSHGSTNAASIDPATGRPYGSRFPDLTMADIVNADRLLLRDLGVARLVAVMGPSFGGAAALQWAAFYPDEMAGIIAASSSPVPGNPDLAGLIAELARDPNWNGGDYYGRGDMVETLTRWRVATLRSYGTVSFYESLPDAASREAALHNAAAVWARQFDANSLVILRKALMGFDLLPHLDRIRAYVLYVLSRSDPRISPARHGGWVMRQLMLAGVKVEYCEVDSDYGHAGTQVDAAKWAPRLRAFIADLV